jgi:SAM-dependent methyltransferase
MPAAPSFHAFHYLFDWRYYIATYPDLAAAGIATEAQAIAHWLAFGRNEHRSYGLTGIEIGGSAHNQFYLNTLNVDYCASPDTIHKQEERRICGHALRVDVAARGERLPFRDKSFDFVISSHVIEHFFDPIAALYEWVRVARKYVFIIVPHRDRTPDRIRSLTTVNELADRHSGKIPFDRTEGHHFSVWDMPAFIELCNHCRLHLLDRRDPDDKVGNGFTVVVGV